jgi:hypothetical protein
MRNLGVVGPSCAQGNTGILTHDFVHRTHVAVFGFHYPRSLPDWSADDWITRVYEVFEPTRLSVIRHDVTVEHRRSLGQRYREQDQQVRLHNLNAEARSGAERILEWVQARVSRSDLSYTVLPITCC